MEELDNEFNIMETEKIIIRPTSKGRHKITIVDNIELIPQRKLKELKTIISKKANCSCALKINQEGKKYFTAGSDCRIIIMQILIEQEITLEENIILVGV